MNILHINTYDRGGAANAAIRLHQALLKEGVNSKFLCLHKTKSDIPELFSFERSYPSFWKKGLKKLGLYRTNREKITEKIRKLSGKYEAFTFPITDFDLLKNPLVQEADIINLHWVANFLDWPSFFKGINKPIVWTLHDMNPFQGGFHYWEDKKNNELAFSELENDLCEIKTEILSKYMDLHIVTPSKWLLNESKKSQILGDFPHHHIHYSLDLEIFKPHQQSFARDVFGFPDDKKILLFVSQSTTNRRKGLDLLRSALEQLEDKSALVTVAIGSKPKDEASFAGVQFLGSIHDERLMALAYSAADAFVIPSREDNLPNVMLESIACGRPVIGFTVGGIEEVITNGLNGVLSEEVNAECLAVAITKALEFPFDLDWIRQDAVGRFDQKVQANRYIELFKKLLN